MCDFRSLTQFSIQCQRDSLWFSETVRSSSRLPAAYSGPLCHSASLVRRISSLLLALSTLVSYLRISSTWPVDTATAKLSTYSSTHFEHRCLTECVGRQRSVFMTVYNVFSFKFRIEYSLSHNKESQMLKQQSDMIEALPLHKWKYKKLKLRIRSIWTLRTKTKKYIVLCSFLFSFFFGMCSFKAQVPYSD